MSSSRLLVFIISALTFVKLGVQASYPPTFFNKTGCLYSYVEGGKYYFKLPESADADQGNLNNPIYDYEKSNCTDGIYPGNLVVTFFGDPNNMNNLTVHFQFKSFRGSGYWEITKASLSFNSVRTNYNKTTYDLKVNDWYAGERYSFSCSQLGLTNLYPGKQDPYFKVTLKRFQLQPFHELEHVVFAPSYDCAVWITMPVLMGGLLMLFITGTVMIGVYLMLELGNQTGDLKFSKQGGMLMNQAQLDATKG